jgi:hypothetical protein
MKIPGAIYIDKESDKKFLAVYGFRSDVLVYPFDIDSGIKPLAHFSYSKGARQGAVDIYPLKKEKEPETVKINKTILADRDIATILEDNEVKETRSIYSLIDTYSKYNVHLDILKDIPEIQKDGIEIITLMDINVFCGDKTSKQTSIVRINHVDEIIPKTKLEKVKPSRPIDGGKSWFVPSCGLEGNIDFGKGCISSWIPFNNNSKFDSSTQSFIGYAAIPWAECDYCYAGRRHKSFPKTIHDLDKTELRNLISGDFSPGFSVNKKLGRPISILRFGKRTEVGDKLFRGDLINTLEIMVDYNTKGVIPTKFLDFDINLINLLKKTKTVILYGIGFPEFEKGAVMQGKTNEYRIEQMSEYRNSGVNAVPYLHIFGGDSPTKRDLDYISYFKKRNIPIQLLPIRFSSKKVFNEMTGKIWEKSIKTNQLTLSDHEETRGYEIYERNLTSLIHKDWLNIIKDNNRLIRLCHHNSKDTYCGGCFQKPGVIEKTIYQEKIFKGIAERKQYLYK